MAVYHVKASGNDSNSGTFASPWLTLSRVLATSAFSPLLTAGDVVYCHDDLTLSASLTSTVAFSLLAYPGRSPKILGAFDLNLNSATYLNIFGIGFGAGNGSNAKLVVSGNGEKVLVQQCLFEETTQNNTKQAIRTSSTSAGGLNLILRDCTFKIGTNTSTPALISNNSTGTIFVSMDNCTVDGYTNKFGGGSNNRITGIFKNNSYLNMPYILPTIDNALSGFLDFSNNSFVNCVDFIRYSTTTTLASDKIRLSRNAMFFTGKIIDNQSTGILTLTSVLNDSNYFLSATNITNLTATNTSTLANIAAAQFYSTTLGSEDLRIEITSPLASFPNHTGRYAPDWDPTIWISNTPDNKVEAGYQSRYLSRLTNNRTGTLATGGETDVNKVLSTSSLVSGTINPNTVLASNANGTLPLSAVKASNGGTLPINKIAPSQGGSYNGSESNGTLSASQLKLGEVVLNLGSNVTGTYDPITGNWEAVSAADLRFGVSKKQNGSTVNGLLNLPSEDYVKALVVYDNGTKTGNRTDASQSYVLTGSGTYGANGTEFTPGYTPDFPERVNVAPDDTVDGLAGTMDLPALNRVSPNDTLRGVQGTQDLPALNRVSPNDTLEGATGTQDLPSLSSILTTDTLEGQAGTANVNTLANLPATNKVISGTTYGLNLEFTGTAVELDLSKFTDLSPSRVEAGYQWKYNSTTNNRTGTYSFDLSNFTQLPPASVKYGIEYKYNGVDYVGSYGQPPTIEANNILSGLVGLIEEKITLLLPTHKPLQYVNEIEKNTWNNNQKRYGVLIKDGQEVSGPIGHNSISQQFELILTDGFMNKPLSDSIQRSKALALQDISQQIYRELCKNSMLFNYTYYNVREFSVASPEVIEKDNVCIVRTNINITYRQKL